MTDDPSGGSKDPAGEAIREDLRRVERWKSEVGRTQVVAWSLALFVTVAVWTLLMLAPGSPAELRVAEVPRIASSDAFAALQIVLVLLAAVAFGEVRVSKATQNGAGSSTARNDVTSYWLSQTAVIGGLISAVLGVWGAIGAWAEGDTAGARLGGSVTVLACAAVVVALSAFAEFVVPDIVKRAESQRRADNLVALRARIAALGGDRSLGDHERAGVRKLLLTTPAQAAVVGIAGLLAGIVLQGLGWPAGHRAAGIAIAGLVLLAATAMSAFLVIGSWGSRPRQSIVMWIASPAIMLVALSVGLVVGGVSWIERLLLLAPSATFVLAVALAAYRGRHGPVSPIPVEAPLADRLRSMDRSFELGSVLVFSLTPSPSDDVRPPGDTPAAAHSSSVSGSSVAPPTTC